MPRKTKARKQTGKGVMDILKSIHQVVKDNKLISRGLGMIPHPAAQGLGWAAGPGQAGYGRRAGVPPKKCPRCKKGPKGCHQSGCGFFGDLFGGLGNGVGQAFGGLGGGIGSILSGAIHGRGSAIV